MSTPGHRRDEDGLDRLLRESLPDDLPSAVEARMVERLRAFRFSRRAERPAGARGVGLLDGLLSPLVRWTPARLALAGATALLLASGLRLQAVAAAGTAEEPLRRIQLSVSLFRALRGVSSLRCAGLNDAALESPVTLAEFVYRRWVPVHARAAASGDILATYRSAETAADYELVLDGATLLPRQIQRTEGLLRTGEATCTWTTPPAVSGSELR